MGCRRRADRADRSLLGGHQTRVVFFATEPRFLQCTPMCSIVIGEQPSWDPRTWAERHRGHRSFKEQLRRARPKGVSVARIHTLCRTS